MAQASPQRRSLGQVRMQLIQLSQQQIVLREKLVAYVQETGESLNSIAQRSGISWGSLSAFYGHEQPLTQGKGLKGLTELLGVQEVGERIESLSVGIADRDRGLANYNEDIIKTVFDLKQAFESRAEQLSMVEFSTVFDEHKKLVLGALNSSKEVCEALDQSTQLNHDILDVLLDEKLDEKLLVIREHSRQVREEKIAEVERLMERLLPFYEDKLSLMFDLGFARNSLHKARLGTASVEQLDKFIAGLSDALAAEQADPDLDDLGGFQALYGQMREALGSQKAVADALGIAASTLSDATRGRVSPERLATLHEKAKEIVSSFEEGEGDNTPDSSETETVLPMTETAQDLSDDTEASVSSVDQDVQVPPVFQNVPEDEDEDIDALIEALKKSLRRSGVLLYAVARLKDPEMKARMSRPDVQRLMDEIYMALELATSTHPGALTDLYQARREQRESRFASNPKKGAK